MIFDFSRLAHFLGRAVVLLAFGTALHGWAQNRAISYGSLVQGSITGNTATFSFSGATDDVVLIRLTVDSGGLFPQIRLTGPDRVPVCANTPNGSTVVEMICTLRTTGAQSITVTGVQSSTGSFSLQLLRLVNPDAPSIGFGDTFSGSLNGQLLVLTFEAEAGDFILARMAVTSGSIRPEFSIFDPSGERICGDKRPDGIAQVSRCGIPSDGVYTLVIGEREGRSIGNFELYLNRLNNPLSCQRFILGDAKAGQVNTGGNAAEKARSGVDFHCFDADPNDRLVVQAYSIGRTMDPEIILMDLQGLELCKELDNSESGFARIADCSVPEGGTYVLLVKDYQDNDEGDYQLYINRLNRPVGAHHLVYGQTVTGQMRGNYHFFSFHATQGDLVSPSLMITNGIASPEVQLLSPDGDRLCIDFDPNGSTAAINNCPIPVSGVYTLLVKDHNDLGQADFQLTLSSSATPGETPPIVDIIGPTNASTFSIDVPVVQVFGTATAASGIAAVAWVNDRGGSGSAQGRESWSTGNLTLQPGLNRITITATANNQQTASDVIEVTYHQASGLTAFLLSRFDSDGNLLLSDGELRTITALNLDGLGFSDMSALSSLIYLRELSCRNNGMAVTPDLSRLASLVILNLGNNRLTSLSDLPPSLQQLFADNNELIHIPDLSRMPQLKRVDFSNGLFVDLQVPSPWPPSLEDLYLHDNHLIDLGSLPATLITLDAHNNNLATFPEIEHLTRLKGLDLRNNQLSSCEPILAAVARDLDQFLYEPQTNGLTCTIDRQPPVVVIRSPGPGQTVEASVIQADGYASDNIGIKKIVWSTDKDQAGTIPLPANKLDLPWLLEQVPLSPGSNKLTITAEDLSGNIGSQTVTVIYDKRGINIAPILTPRRIPVYVPVGSQNGYQMDAHDNDPATLTWLWDFGDIYQYNQCSESFPREGVTTCVRNHSYPEPGLHDLQVTVFDQVNEPVTYVAKVNVHEVNSPPVIQSFTAQPNTAEASSMIRFEAEVTDTDPDLFFEWTLGDGSSYTTRTSTFAHSYDRPGEYLAHLAVSDGNGGRDEEASRVLITDIAHPGVGIVELGSRFQETHVGERAQDLDIDIFNSGNGTLDYQVRLAGLDPDEPWITLRGLTSGSLQAGDAARTVSLHFPNTFGESWRYRGRLEVVSNQPGPPVYRDFEVYVSRASKNPVESTSQGKLALQWNGDTPGVAKNRIEIFAPGQSEPSRVLTTPETSIMVEGLVNDLTHQIKVTPLDQMGRQLDQPLVLSGKTQSLATFRYRLVFPHVAQNRDFWTGLALVNPNPRANRFQLVARAAGDRVLQTSELSTLGPFRKTLGQVSKYFDGQVLEAAATLEVLSELPLAGLELFGDTHGALMSGVPADDTVRFSAHLLAGLDPSSYCAVSLVNPSAEKDTRIDLDLFDDSGLLLDTKFLVLVPGEKKAFTLNEFVPIGLRNRNLWTRLRSDQALIGFTLWGKKQSQRHPVTQNGAALLGSGTTWSLLPYWDGNSRIYLANTASAGNAMTLTYYRPDGTVLRRETRHLQAHALARIGLSEGQGSLLVQSSLPHLVTSDNTVLRAEGEALAEAILGQGAIHDSFVVPHVALGEEWDSDLLLANGGASPVTVAIEGYDEAGHLVDKAFLEFAAFGSVRRSIASFYDAVTAPQISWLRITAPPKATLAGQVLFYGREGQAAVMGGSQLIPWSP